MTDVHLHSPRPTPFFQPEPYFSQRRKTPFKAPPKAPAKSCPPLSRVFTSAVASDGPHTISFASDSINEPISGLRYSTDSQEPYFEQGFEIIKKIGEGSFGEVFQVKSREDGQLYAIKRSRQRFTGSWDRRKKLDEVEKHECLPPHPNCIRFYKAWEENLHLYIQTELCSMSLSQYCDAHGRLPERTVWRILMDIGKGLKHLHDNRLCHLDIKPDNIFLSQSGTTWKLGDFGLVSSMDTDFEGASEGDACYMAPELMEGRFSPGADVFSLGISMLEVACDLQLPSNGESWHMLRRGELPEDFIKNLSPDLLSLLTSMMSHNPQSRPCVNQILGHRKLRRMQLFEPAVKLKNKIVPLFSRVFQWILRFFVILLNLLRLSHSPMRPETPPTLGKPQSLGEPLSDSEDEDIRMSLLQQSISQHNGSWTNHSPICHQYPVYSGSPIPLHLDDSSADEATPLKPGSPLLTSSPATFPRADRAMRRVHSDRGFVNGGPRNLMEIFKEAD
ncbi:PREDICTED: membrane-associated tyrosine- and threonine-specific cdc2-inhibitory kinase-like isoform X2 [Amphimedon queenslandica]|uniref:Membrane-associated tyrosine- and threonine-specific cdc2-inhibitory kinase n=1 Tax=Amphimedon queenslandica TaxID=400682 RepID=A0A1X7V5E8_AMPQE|nr:PREDICTED: membrane-associated tyrosine- and threonine-specific cdc2-inhibitory kinase-like isoform X1 [Amphimedon queenslandica]XP_019850440.1 PREDICTED: membrane-associated tyrosine- and threonine-specific cdc2-inhibitory kinase-like isoform X2 [Amphimedon queenslandica]|eukprot:XP_011403057.1 PREDICTED: membrane-associated tyrosine- and threonine-specific cdc2-inhibitory kinase-like isoform X1 [Amphimedon queenslandica]